MSRPVFLIGIMASGKSTLGQALSERLPNRRFIDLDAAVEARAGMSVSEIFARHGQEHFRHLESACLAEAAASNAIVACGGGTPCRPENMDLMLRSGTVVWLTAPTAVIVRRLQLAPATQRPLVAEAHGDADRLAGRINELVQARTPAYSRAHIKFDASHLESAAEITTAVESLCKLIPDLTHHNF